jgi:hypothetical protein
VQEITDAGSGKDSHSIRRIPTGKYHCAGHGYTFGVLGVGGSYKLVYWGYRKLDQRAWLCLFSGCKRRCCFGSNYLVRTGLTPVCA